MSRIGKLPIKIASGIEVKIENNTITTKSGEKVLSFTYLENISLEQEGDVINVIRKDDTKKSKSLHGLTRSIIFNMIEGISKGFTKKLEIVGVGYRASVSGSKLVLNLGYSNPKELIIPKELKVTQEGNKKEIIVVTGIDKQQVGQFTANIRELRKPEPYKGKGIRYQGEYVRRKAGKSAK